MPCEDPFLVTNVRKGVAEAGRISRLEMNNDGDRKVGGVVGSKGGLSTERGSMVGKGMGRHVAVFQHVARNVASLGPSAQPRGGGSDTGLVDDVSQ